MTAAGPDDKSADVNKNCSRLSLFGRFIRVKHRIMQYVYQETLEFWLN